MFNLDEYYEQCKSGEKVNSAEMFQYIKSFNNIIIRGAAGQGKALGRRLSEEGIKITVYWDQAANEMEDLDGVRIELPLSNEYDREKTVVIYAIPNHVIMKTLINELKENSYTNIIRGDILYSGICCPYGVGDKMSASRCWQTGECRSVICERAKTIVEGYNQEVKPGNRIDLAYNCFIINSLCNLRCTHCVQNMNSYKAKDRINIPVDNILRDIDLWLELVDSVGTISVMGGETFMHPEIGKIMKKFSEKKNFGFVSFPTNGLYPIEPEQLEGIDDPRIIIAFGYYLHIANEKQKEIYCKNVELVKSYGISYTESRYLPAWTVPSGLYKVPYADENFMIKKKQNCLMPPRNLQIRDGKIHTCDRGVTLYATGYADYPTDYFTMLQPGDLSDRREKFREFVERSFYYTCGHCGEKTGIANSAQQGIIDVFDPKTYENIENMQALQVLND